MMAANGNNFIMVTSLINLTPCLVPSIFNPTIKVNSTKKKPALSHGFKNTGKITANESAIRLSKAASLKTLQPKKNNQLIIKPAKLPKAAST